MRFFRTGDVGELRDGQVHIIDRIGALFKLAQVPSSTHRISFSLTM